MAININTREKKRDVKGAISSLAKAVVSAIPSLVIGDFASLAKSSGSSLSNLIDAALSLNKDTSNQVDFSAWDVTRASFAAGLSIFLAKVELEKALEGKELEAFVEAILQRTDTLLSRGIDKISLESLTEPLLLPTFRDATKCIPLDLRAFGPIKSPQAVRRDFEKALFAGFQITRITKPDLFKQVEDALAGPLNIAGEQRDAQGAHKAYIVRGFSQIPIFGQEQSGLTISDLYVKQRCLWYCKESQKANDEEQEIDGLQVINPTTKKEYKRRFVRRLYVGDLHKQFAEWLSAKDGEDAIRVVAGGPGSGKSTFARSFAISCFDSGDYDVLFVPLQEISLSGSFEQRIEVLYHNRSELGFDRVRSPLEWLGRTAPNGSSPLKPLLLICDGLDEIATPESREAVNVTLDFIQALSLWIRARNSGGCYAKCVILGRDGAAEEAFAKLNINSEKLLYVGGLRPLSHREDWQKHKSSDLLADDNSLSLHDQRVEYWHKWAEFFKLDKASVPLGLREAGQTELALQELTAEPLLLYLLLWTGFLGDRWREAADNRNVVYQEIFNRIYRRDWANKKSCMNLHENRSSGGHPTTLELTIEDFFVFQEGLGLAAWPTGGRIVSKSSFDRTLKLYLPEELYDDFLKNPNLSLKSVALHSYTRSSDLDEPGYEFVHKSLGEYLIARGLVGAISGAVKYLNNRVIDEKCKRASKQVARVGSLGVLTPEISRFFSDEIRLAIFKWDVAKKCWRDD